MKPSKNLIDILKNCNTINSGIKFKKGNVLNTIAISDFTILEVTLNDEDVIKNEFGVYDLSEFLNTLALFKNPELKFKDSYFEIIEEEQKVRYGYAYESTIHSIDESPSFEGQENQGSFRLEKFQLEKLLQASKVLKLKHLGISKKGIRTFNYSQSGTEGNEFWIKMDINTDSKQELVVDIDNLKIIPASYDVKLFLGAVDAIELTTTELPIAEKLRYIVALEA